VHLLFGFEGLDFSRKGRCEGWLMEITALLMCRSQPRGPEMTLIIEGVAEPEFVLVTRIRAADARGRRLARSQHARFIHRPVQ
jgi:hypothetical protein